jgi:hypothetical protein
MEPEFKPESCGIFFKGFIAKRKKKGKCGGLKVYE